MTHGGRAFLLLAVFAFGAGCSSSGSTDSPTVGAPSGTYVGHGQNIQRISFTVDGQSVTGLRGTYAVSCASTSGSSYQTQTFVDPDRIAIGVNGAFSDSYRFAVSGGAQATLTVEGTVTGGAATGHLQFAEPSCGTPRDGWAAAVSGQALPPVPSFTPADTTGCAPQPCSTLGGVVLHVDAVHVISKAGDPNTKGLDVEFSVANGSSKPVSVSDGNMRLVPQSGPPLYSSYAEWVDASGQQVGCLHGNVPLLPPNGSETAQHACFQPPADQIGQPFTLRWELTGSGTATFAIGAAQ